MINYYLNAILISNTHTTLNLKIATKVMLTKSTSLDSFIHNSNFNQARMSLCVTFTQLSLYSYRIEYIEYRIEYSYRIE